jgi:succinoglycan biosynthesis transport protein ExoP
MFDQVVPQAGEVSLRDYMDMLVRRRLTILKTFALVFSVGAALTWATKPTYKASGRIAVVTDTSAQSRMASDLPFNDIFLSNRGNGIDTQIEILRSEKLLDEAHRMAHVPRGAATVKAEQVDKTDVIKFDVESNQMEYAARLATFLPEAYRIYLTTSRKTGINNALKFVQSRYDEESAKLINAEVALNHFRLNRHVVDIPEQRKGQIDQALKLEETLRAEESRQVGFRATLSQLQAVRNALPEYLTIPVTTNNITQIEARKDHIAQLKNERASLLVLFKPTHVKVQELDAKISDAEELLARTPDKITTTTRQPNPEIRDYEQKIATAKGELASTDVKVDKTRAAVATSQRGLSPYGALELEQARLQRDVERHGEAAKSLNKTLQDLNLREKMSDNPVETLNTKVKAALVGPLRIKSLIYASLIGLILGFCIALIQEYLDDRVSGPEDASRLLEAPPLGYVPFVESEKGRLIGQGGEGGSLIETYRLLRSNVQFASVDDPAQLLLVTSSMPGEGKSVTACNLAAVAALNGKRVILIDADLRRPTLHEKFNLNWQPGLTNVLIGHSTLEEALQKTDVPELQILTSGHLPPNPSELLNSRAMQDLLQELRTKADLIIFDTSPILAAADAQVLAAEVDGVLFVVQIGETRKSAVRVSGDLLRQARARVLGVVFNKIRLESRSMYGYGNYKYYGAYRYYSQYSQYSSQVPGEKSKRSQLAAEFEALPYKHIGEGVSNDQTNGSNGHNSNSNNGSNDTNGKDVEKGKEDA